MLAKIKNFLTQPEILVITLSVCITLGISSLIGIGSSLIIGSFWGPFFLSFGLQFVLFFIINTILQKRDALAEAKIVTEQLNTLSKYYIKLSCAYCSKPNSTPIVLNQENRFKCEYCQQVNGVKMQFFSTQITVPIEKVLIPTETETITEFKVTR
jgi:hypothetical protein